MRVRELFDRVVTDRVILVAGWVWFLVYAYPGYMSYDSAWQLSQARHIELRNDWQPPSMAWLWHLLDLIVAGPFPMLVLQSLTFVLGFRALFAHVMPKRAAAAVAVLLLLLPQNIVVMGVIWKDSQMAGFLAAGLACLLSERRWVRVAGYLFIFLASAVRYNAAAATLPIILAQFGAGGALPKWRRLALASAAWVGITVASFVFNGLLVEEHKYPWPTGAAILDIAGTIRFAPHYDNDELLRDTAGVPWHKTDKIQIRIRSWYHPENQFLNVTEEPGQIFEYPSTDAERAAITAAWKKLVFEHPLAFLRHRIGVFGAQLDCDAGGAGGVYADFTNPTYIDLLGHRAVHSWLQLRWVNRMHTFDGTLVFRVGLYFLLSIALLPLCRRQRLALIVLLSGIFHELGLFWVAPAIDYRYSHWMVACALAGAVILFVRRFRPPAPA
jgi:hypothetical protein